tara:strand:+ start:662 stop:1234 length:573 start_codon:yes stop_codon:yes gene_type:complete
MGITKKEEKDILKEFEKLICSNIGDYLLLKNPTVEPLTLHDDEEKVLSNWMTFVLLTNPNFSLYFKFYYNHSILKKIITIVFKDNDKATDIHFMNDYMKELSNTLGGRLNELIRTTGIDLIMSSPFIATGFDDIFLEKDKKPHGFKSIWKIDESPYSFLFSIELKSNSPEEIERLKGIKGYEEQDEIDFF